MCYSDHHHRRRRHHDHRDDDNDDRRRDRHRRRHHDDDRDRDRKTGENRGRKTGENRGRKTEENRDRKTEEKQCHKRRSSSSSSPSSSLSSSSAKKKRISGFDVAPAGNLATVVPIPEQATRHARRVYVGGFPPTTTEEQIKVFFTHVMSAVGAGRGGVINVYLNTDKNFAFVELTTVEEASNAMALDGVTFEGTKLRVRRPTDYNPSAAAHLGPTQPNPNLNLSAVGLESSPLVPDGPDRVFVGGLPYHLTEDQVREFLETFGKLKAFNLVKDRETGGSKGYAFCVFDCVPIADIACGALNGFKLGNKTLTVRRSSNQTGGETALPQQKPSKALCLKSVVSVNELRDDDEYEDVLDDMRTECEKLGNLVNVIIPRPRLEGDESDQVEEGVGDVFLVYADFESSGRAYVGLNGRKFGENRVEAVFFPEDKLPA